MAKKLTPKQIDMMCHEAMVHCNRMVEIFDEFRDHFSEKFAKQGKPYKEAEYASKFRDAVENMLPLLEQMNETSFGMESIKSSTYLTELTTKFQSVVRNNFQKIQS